MIDVSVDAQVPSDPSPAAGLAQRLRAWGLGGLAAALLQSDGPLPYLGAQALYFAAPVLDAFGGQQASDWARWLEDPEAVRALAEQLAQEG